MAKYKATYTVIQTFDAADADEAQSAAQSLLDEGLDVDAESTTFTVAEAAETGEEAQKAAA